jgi:hypothetical protein
MVSGTWNVAHHGFDRCLNDGLGLHHRFRHDFNHRLRLHDPRCSGKCSGAAASADTGKSASAPAAASSASNSDVALDQHALLADFDLDGTRLAVESVALISDVCLRVSVILVFPLVSPCDLRR